MKHQENCCRLLSAALDYGGKGWQIIPLHEPKGNFCSCSNPKCSSIGKHPRTPHGVKDASSDLDIIRQWWNKWPSANIGIATGQRSMITVVDVDLKHDGDKNWREFYNRNSLQKTLQAKSGSGGYHCYYAYANHLGNKAGFLPGVDIRGNGGYIVAPPSLHHSGNHYEWTTSFPLAIFPTAVMHAIHKKSDQQINKFPEGKRNSTLISIAGFMKRQGISSPVVINALKAVNPILCSPPLAVVEIEKMSQSVSQFEVNDSQWQKPKNLPQLKLHAPSMSEEFLPPSLSTWILDICDRMQVPLEFVAAPAIVSAGSIIGRQVGIFPKQEDDWLIVANLWGGIVARPGCLKSPAIAEAMKPVEALITKAHKDFEAAKFVAKTKEDLVKARIEGVKEQIKKAVKMGKMTELNELENQYRDFIEMVNKTKISERRFKTNDATIEKIGMLLHENPQGLLVFRDELAGWLQNLNRSDREADRTFFLESWNGFGVFDVDRVLRGHTHIPALCLSIFGGIQPARLANYVTQATGGGKDDDGLLQRFQLLVYPDIDRNWKYVDRKPKFSAFQSVATVYEKLANLRDMKSDSSEKTIPGMHFDQKAQELFINWWQNHENRLNSEKPEIPAIESHLAKFRKLVPALALIFHLLENQTSESSVSSTSLELALKWVHFLELHARKIYGDVQFSELLSAEALANKIRSGKVQNGDSIRSIYRRHWARLDSPEATDQAVDVLERHHWLRVEQTKSGARPSEVIRFNPNLENFFSSQNKKGSLI